MRKDIKIEISLRDLILYVIVLVLFIWGFLKFQVYEMELGLAQRHGQINQNDKNVQVLNQNLQDHDQRLKRLEALNKTPTDTFVKK